MLAMHKTQSSQSDDRGNSWQVEVVPAHSLFNVENDTISIESYLPGDIRWIPRARTVYQQEASRGALMREGFYKAMRSRLDWSQRYEQGEYSYNVLVVVRSYRRLEDSEVLGLSFLLKKLPEALGALSHEAEDDEVGSFLFQPHWWLWEQGCVPVTMYWRRGGGVCAPRKLPGMDWCA